MKYKIEPYTVVIVPLWQGTTDLYTRTFRVPQISFHLPLKAVEQVVVMLLMIHLQQGVMAARILSPRKTAKRYFVTGYYIP